MQNGFCSAPSQTKDENGAGDATRRNVWAGGVPAPRGNEADLRSSVMTPPAAQGAADGSGVEPPLEGKRTERERVGDHIEMIWGCD